MVQGEVLDLDQVNWRWPTGQYAGMRQSASCENLGQEELSETESEEQSPGGVQLNQRSWSPGRKTFKQKAASSAGEAKKGTFAPSDDDDVFARQGAAAAEQEEHEEDVRSERSFTEEAHGQVAGAQVADAQADHPASACLFVANLPKCERDDALQAELERILSTYEVVQVKIRRDGRQMPFAFCQFETTDRASEAAMYCEGAPVFGRPCRVEVANAHTNFIVYKRDGSPILIDEARMLLSSLGEVDKAVRLNPAVQRREHLPDAIVISYKLFDKSRDPARAFAKSERFIVKPFAPKAAEEVLNRRQTLERQRHLVTSERDHRSLFVGNLPPNLPLVALKAFMEECGPVVNVEMHKRSPAHPQGRPNCFAFVEYALLRDANNAQLAMRNAVLRNHTLRVNRKMSPGEQPRGDVRALRQTPPSASTGRLTSRMGSSHHHQSQSSFSRFTSPMNSNYTPSHMPSRSSGRYNHRSMGSMTTRMSGSVPNSASKQHRQLSRGYMYPEHAEMMMPSMAPPAQNAMMQAPWYPQYPAYGYSGMGQYPQWPMMPQGGPGMPMGAYMPQTQPFFNYYPEPYPNGYVVPAPAPAPGPAPSVAVKEETNVEAAEAGKAANESKVEAEDNPEEAAEKKPKEEADSSEKKQSE